MSEIGQGLTELVEKGIEKTKLQRIYSALIWPPWQTVVK